MMWGGLIKAGKAVQLLSMLRLLRALFFAFFALALGAQAMVMLERGEFALVTLGQCLALFYWPNPTEASAVLDAMARGAGGAGRILAIPAVIAFGGVLLVLSVFSRRKRR